MATENHPTKTWIRERFDYWQERMLLKHWDIMLCIIDSSGVDDEENVGSCHPKPNYLMGTVTIARKQSKVVVDAAIVHELGHVITSDFVRKVKQLDLNESTEAMVRDMNETLVSHFSNILMEIEGQNGAR